MDTFSNEQLAELLQAQRTLNEKYTGTEWMKEVPLDYFLVAVQTEVSEYFESAPENWKWWKKTLKNDTQNMIIETIDVLHFALSVLMYAGDDEQYLYLNNTIIINQLGPTEKDPGSILTHMCSFITRSQQGSTEKMIVSFYRLMESMAKSCDRSLDQIYDGYFKKNELNHKRVDGGYQEGNYQKIDADGNEDNVALDV